MKLTKEQIEQIAIKVETIGELAVHEHDGSETNIRIRELQELEKKNKAANIKLGDSCYFGPFSASELLAGTKLERELDDYQKEYYIMALEEVLGKSTTMEYDKSKNEFIPNTPTHGDNLAYDPKDVELGLWDKICAFFGIITDHAKKVEFAQKSIEAQQKKLDGLNKSVVKQKKDNFVEKHKDFAERNEAVLNEAEKTENGLKELFFGDEKVADYTFKNGGKLTALSACIAMYHKEGGKDIANMSLEEINKPENADLRNRLREIGNEYKTIISEKGLDEKLKYLDDFLFTNDKYNTRDKALLDRMATTKAFEIDWDKAEKNIKGTEQKKELAGAQSLAMLKVKAELRKVFGAKLPDGKQSGYDQLNEKDKEHLNAFKDVREYKLFVDEISNENYNKANEHLGKIKGLEGFDKKPTNYSEFLDKVDSMVSQKELTAPTKENKEIEEIQNENEWEI